MTPRLLLLSSYKPPRVFEPTAVISR